LQHFVGQGASGRVYRGQQLDNDRDAAIKVLDTISALPASQRESALSAIRRSCQVTHPNLCPVWEAGTDDGVSYLTMPFLSGLSLADLLQFRETPFTSRQASQLVLGIAGALQAVHQQGLAHGNLQPRNVMLLASGGTPMLMDLGVNAGAATPAADVQALAELYSTLRGSAATAPTRPDLGAWIEFLSRS